MSPTSNPTILNVDNGAVERLFDIDGDDAAALDAEATLFILLIATRLAPRGGRDPGVLAVTLFEAGRSFEEILHTETAMSKLPIGCFRCALARLSSSLASL